MFSHIFQLYLFAEKPLMLHLTLVKAFELGDSENPLKKSTVIISSMFDRLTCCKTLFGLPSDLSVVVFLFCFVFLFF